ncbi:MAG: hypothetical protein IPL79_09450 [Myxococcales bacterium]|nr:hypothetical protein [Myxococcales bacterium]
MSNHRDSDRDLGAGDRLAAEDADVRLDARLRQRLAASAQYVPAPSEAMLAALREAARQQAATASTGGIMGWLGTRPRHMWAAIGSVAVASAAVAGLVMLQKSDHGVDRQASAMLEDRREIREMAPAAASPPPSVAGAPVDQLGTKDSARRQADKAMQDADDQALAGKSKLVKKEASADERLAAMKPDRASEASKFAVAPAAELEQDQDGYKGLRNNASEGKVGSAAGSASFDDSAVQGSDAAPTKKFAEPRPRAVASAPSMDEKATAERADVVTATDSVTSAPPSTLKAPKPLPVDVAALAKAGRCSDASKAATARRKSDAGYTAQQVEQDMAPCSKAEQKKAPSKATAAPTSKK